VAGVNRHVKVTRHKVSQYATACRMTQEPAIVHILSNLRRSCRINGPGFIPYGISVGEINVKFSWGLHGIFHVK